MEDDRLVHYGVLGMKWGVRKKRPKKSSGISGYLKRRKSIKAAKKREANRVKKHEDRDKKPINSMTDKELDNYVKRLQKEKQARDLKKDRMTTGQKIMNDVATQSVTKIGTSVAYQVGMYAIGKSVNKAFGDEVIKTGSSKKKKAA